MNYTEAIDKLALGEKIRISRWWPELYISSGPIPYTPYLYNSKKEFRFSDFEWPSFAEIDSINWEIYHDLPRST